MGEFCQAVIGDVRIGNSGKSVLGSFIRRLYPKESISSIRLKQMKNEFGMSSLANAVINFDMDMPSSKIDEEAASRLKQITGGDSINVPRKFRDDALLERRIKFVFSSNHPLIIDGEDDALLKRIIYLPFNYAIPDDQQDPDLGEKIWKERDAIVTKALRYARKLVKLNYIFPEIPQVDNAKCIVRDSIAKTVGKFVQESCDKSESKAVTATEDLYNAYSDYCKEKNMWACSQKAFTKELTQMKIEHTEFIFGQLAQEAPAKCLNDSEMEQLKRWLKRHEIWIKPEERRYVEQVFQGEPKDRDKTQKMVFDFFGGMETLIQYCYEAEKTLTPRRELVNQLQGRYALQTSTAEWVLNCLMTEGLQRNPDRDAAKELRKNFLEQGGKVM